MKYFRTHRRFISSLMIALMAFWQIGQPLQAATFYWDTDTSDTGNAIDGTNLGGTGDWDLATTNWWDGANPLSLWPNSLLDTAIFNGTAGVVTLGADVNAGTLMFQTGGYQITGGNTLTLGDVARVDVAAFTNARIDSVITGSAGLTKTGNGTLLLGSGGNTYTGDTVINAGALVITNENQLGNSTSTISINGIAQTGNPGFTGGQLVVNGLSTAGSVTMNREISISGRGPGAANASGGVMSIGSNIFDGDVNIAGPVSEGRFRAEAGTTTVNGDVYMGGSIAYFLGGGNVIVNGQVSGFQTANDRFIKSSGSFLASTLWLTNANNDFRQTVRPDAGTIRVSDNGALGVNTGNRAIDFVSGSQGMLEIHTDTPNFDTRNVYIRNNITARIFGNRALDGSGVNQTLQFGNLTRESGTLRYDGRNGYNLSINAANGAGGTTTWTSGANAAFTNNSNGVLTFDGSMRHALTTARTLSFTGNGDMVMTGGFLGEGAAHVLTKTGTGILTIQGTSTYTGQTNLNQGTLSINSFDAITNNTAVLSTGSTTTSVALNYTGGAETLTKAVRLAGTTGGTSILSNGTGGITLVGAITANGAGIKTLRLGGDFGDEANFNTIATAIPNNSATNTTSLHKFGAGSWVLAGPNTFTGSTTVTNGILAMADSGGVLNVLPDTNEIIFDVDAFTQSAGGIFAYAGDGANASAEIVGTLTATAGAGTVAAVSGAGGSAALTFGALGTISKGAGLNFITDAGSSITLPTVAGNINGIVDARVFFNGGDFASGITLTAATYTTEAAGASLVGGNLTPYLVNTTDIAAQASATINAGIKFNDTRALTLAASQTLTINNGANTAGAILVTGGSAVTLGGGSGITSGGSGELVFRVDGAGDTLNLNTPILASSTGGWTKLGAGTLVLGAANANTTGGKVNINEGIVQLTAGGRLGATSVDVAVRQGATLDLNGISLGTAASGTASIDELNGAGAIINSGALASLRVGNGNAASMFTGTISGDISLVKNGSNSFRLIGPQTYTGGVQINAGNLIVTHLADIGQASSLGTGDATDDASNAASLILGSANLYYRGSDGTIYQLEDSPSVSTNRLFTLAGNGAIFSEGRFGGPNRESASNHAALIFNNTAPVAFSGSGNRTLNLRGNSLGDNEIALQLVDNVSGGGVLNLTKNDSAFWFISNTGNSYTGTTLVANGSLRIGEDVDGSRTLPTTSALVLGNAATRGVLQTKGVFDRPLAATATAGSVTFNSNLTSGGGGGFAASTAPLIVNLGGAAATLTWESGGFLNANGRLTLSSNTSWADVDFQNNIDLGAATRIVQVDDNGFTALDYATISGNISGTGNLNYTGGGNLILTGDNTYTGFTQISSSGTLIISSIGGSGATSSSLGAGAAQLRFAGNTTQNLIYAGAGEVTDRAIRFTTNLSSNRTYRIDSSGSGALVINDFANTTNGNNSTRSLFMELRGSNTDGNTLNSVIGNGTGANAPSLALAKFDGGVWILGSNANTFTGGVRADGGLLGLTGNGSLGATGVITTGGGNGNVTTLTVASTAGLKAGMYVNGNGVSYGRYITAVGATSVTLNSASNVPSGTRLQFGGLNVSNGGIFAADPGGLTITQPIYVNSNANIVFAGSYNINIDGPFALAAGNSDITISNSIEGSGVLTFNTDFTNLKLHSRTFNIRGFGDTVWNGDIQDSSAGAFTTSLNIAIDNEATFEMAGGTANGYSGSTTLTNGTLKLSKAGALGTGAFNFNGGLLTSNTGSGVVISNTTTLGSTPIQVFGTESIEFSGIFTGNGTRRIDNNLSGGASLILSGTLNLANSDTARTMALQGSGNTTISGVVANGGTGASNLNMDGTGTVDLTGANTATGTLTVQRGIVNLSGADGSWAGNIGLNGNGVLNLDNSVTENANRLNDTGTVTFSGGTLNFIADADGTAETTGAVTVNGTMGTINMSGGDGPNVLTFASVNFANSGSSLDLSGISELGATNKVIFTTAPTNIFNGVLNRVMILGDFATHTANGVEAFSSYNDSNDLNAAVDTDTMNLTANAGLTNTRTLNALKLNGDGLNIGTGSTAGATLTLSTYSVLNTGGNNTLSIPLVNIAAAGMFQVDPGTTLTVDSTLIGGGQINKAGTGELIFTTRQFQYSTVNISGGQLTLNGGDFTLFPGGTAALTLKSGATLDVNGNVTYMGTLSGPATLPGAAGTLKNSGALTTYVTNAGGGFGGVIQDAINLGRVGSGTLTLELPQTYTGGTALLGGDTTLRDDASILDTTAIEINQARLLLRNNDNLQTQVFDRISDTAPITLRGGTIDVNGRISTPATETMGALTALMGANTITGSTGGGTITSARLTFASLTRTPGATINFTGTNLGSEGNSAKIIFTTPLTTVAGGALGAWAIANTTDYAAYNQTNGVGVVGNGGFVGYNSGFGSGKITNLGMGSASAVTTTLAGGTTTTALLRFHGGFTNNLEFTDGADVLHLEQGGILRSNNNNLANIGTTGTRGVITNGTSELVVYNNQNTLTIHSVIQGATSLVKSGAGTVTLTAENTYNGGTFVNQGTLRLQGEAGAVVLPAGGLTVSGGTVTMVTNEGQIDPTNAVTLNGTATVTLVGSNTLDSITFDNIGGTSNSTLNVGGTLSLSSASAVTTTSRNAATIARIVGGTLVLPTGANTFSVGAPTLFGDVYTDKRVALEITSAITGAGVSINKTGNGLLELNGASTFTGGVNVVAGGIVVGTNSTGTIAGTLFSGPLGSGATTFAAGTVLAVDDSSRTVANAMSWTGSDPIFSNVGTSTDTLTLNGALTFSTLTSAGLVANVDTPYLNVVLGGRITDMDTVTAIGGATGANTITKTGPGNISGLNITGLGSAVPIDIGGLTNLNTFSLQHDGDTTSSLETINLGVVTWNPTNGSNISLTIGRSGSGVNYGTPAYKTLSLAGLNSSVLPNGITLANNNFYGLIIPDAITLSATNNWTVNSASTSLQNGGLTLSGKLSGTNGLTKSGNGILRLGDATNDFTGMLNVTNGTLEVAADGALGDAGNSINLSSNSLAEGLRIAGTFATTRTINLEDASSGIDVTGGNTFTLNTAFTTTTSTNNLRKNDLGTLVLTQAQPGWDGDLTIAQGVVRITSGDVLGTTTGGVILGNVGNSLELDGSGGAITVADAIRIASTNNSSSNGINSSGAIRNFAGNNTITGAITIDTTTANSQSRSGFITAVSGTTLNLEGGVVLGLGTTGSNRDNWISFGGEGTINLTTTGITYTGNLIADGIAWLDKAGSGTLNIQVANAYTGDRVNIKSGTLSLNGAGSLGVPGAGGGTNSIYFNPSGILVLDNSGTAVDNRLGGRNIHLNSGRLNILGNSGAATTETVGTFTIREGLSIFTLDADAARALDFTAGALTRSAGATLLVRGDNLGSASGAGVATFTGSSYAYVGQTGAAGTVTKGILPWALGDTNLSGSGIGFLTSDTAANTGAAILRLLAPSEQSTDLATALANVNLSTNESLQTLTTFNSLRLDSGGGVTLEYVPLTLESGGLLALTGHTGITGHSGVSYLTSTANAELVLHNQADLTLDIPIAATTGTLTKSGAGVLTLAAGNTNHSTVSVNEGTLKLGGGDQTILPGRNMFVNLGATLDLNGAVQQVNILESRQSGSIPRNAMHFGGGTVINSSGTQATLVMATSSSIFAGAVTGNIAVVRSNAAGATADWNLYIPQTWTGPSLFNGGRTIFQDTASLLNTTSIEISNATLLFTASNNNTEAGIQTNRLSDTAPITMSGAMFQFRSRASLITTETMGAVTLKGGRNIIDFAEGGTGVNQTTITMDSLSREAGSRTTLRFLNIDGTPSDDQQLFINTLNGVATTNIGDGLTNHLIGGWATFEREWASYIPGQGVGALNQQGYAGYSPNLINFGGATDNIRIVTPNAGSITTLDGDLTINSLNMQAGTSSTGDSSLDLGGHTLTLASGGIILSPVATTALSMSMTVENGSLTAGTTAAPADLYLHAQQWFNGQADLTGNADVIVNANIVNNAAGGAVTLVISGEVGRGTTIRDTNDVFINGSNTYTGGTFINSGRIRLNNALADGATVFAIPGDLTIAGGYSHNVGVYNDRLTTVIYNAGDQMANTGNLTVMGGAILNLNNFNQTVATLTFDNNGGNNPQVTTGSGTLTVTGAITASGQNASSGSTRIDGKLALAAATATITVNPVEWNSTILNPYLPNLTINAVIDGNNIVKAGTGVLRLSATNGFTGTFDLQAGGVLLGSNNALSTAALTLGNDTFFSSSADNRVILNDFTMNGNFALRDAFSLTMNGAGTIAAGTQNLEVQLAAKTLTLGGTLSGAGGINKIGDGILLLNNSNNYDGVTTVTDGTLIYGAVGAVPAGSALTVQEGTLVDITLGGSAVTVGSLASNSATQGGVIVTTETSGTTVFTAGGDNTSTDFGGTMVATSGATLEFVKAGSGTLTLGANNLYTGKTTIEDGRLVAKAVAGGSAIGTSQSLAFGSAANNTSGILQLGDSAAPLDQTFTSVSSEGTGTANAIVSGNAAMSTLTLDLADTSTFAGNIGLGGANEGNFNLIKNGAGDLVISGTGTSTYSGTTAVNGGKLFFDTVGGFSATTTSLTVADGTEFTLRGNTGNTVTSYGFGASAGAKIVVDGTTGATLGFGIDGAVGVNQLVLATGQTLQLTGTLTTAIYVNAAPTSLNEYVLIDGADAGSLTGFGGTFNLNPVVFNGGSFTYALALTSGVNGGGLEQWTLTPTAVPSQPDTWWTGDLTGLAQGVWSATLTTGTGFPSNWADDADGLTDALVPPDGDSNVHFSAAGAANFDTTLGADMTIKSLTFHTGNVATTIGSSNGINTLTLGNGVDATFLTLETGVGDVGISAIVNLPQDQSWNIEAAGNTLTLSGGLTGTSRTLTINDNTSATGTLLFSGSAASMTGTLAVVAGNLVFEDTGSLNSGLDVVLGDASTSATLKVGNTTEATGAVIGGLSNGAFAGSRVIGGNATISTLTIGSTTGSHTFSGALGGAGTNENNFNLVKAGAGTQILDGAITYAGTTLVTEGTLQLGANSAFGPAGLLSVLANAGVTATFDFNGKDYTTVGDLVLGGGADGIAQVLDTNGTKGTFTLGGNIIYDATNDPGAAVMSTDIVGTGANRTISVGDSAGAVNELTLNGSYTSTSNNNLNFDGAGNGVINGNINVAQGTTGSSNRDVNFNSTGTWTVNAKIEVGDDIIINTGVINATAGESLDAKDDVIVDGTGTPGSAIVNISSTSQVHTGDAIYIRRGALINVTGDGGIGTGTGIVYVGDSASTTAASAGVLNLSANISPGQIMVGNGTNIGFVTGTGTITSTSNRYLRNGEIGAGITLAGNGVMLRDGTGTLTFYGARATSTGDTLLRESTLILDYSLNNASKIGDVLQLGYTSTQRNPVLIMNGGSSASITETMLRSIILPGHTTVGINNGAGQTATLALQAITRSVVGGTVGFEYSSTDAKAASTSPAGILGWATVKIGAGGAPSLAAIDGSGNIVAATLTTQNDVTAWAVGQNIVNDAALTGAIDCTHIDSLTFAAAEASTLTINPTGDLRIGSGGILVSESVGAFDTVITGGSLHGTTSGTSGEIIVHQHNTSGLLTISSDIVNSGGVTKTGAGTLVLAGNNTYTPGSVTHVNEGTLRLSGGNAIADNDQVRLKFGSTLDLGDSTETIGSITDESNGTLALGTSGALRVNQAFTADYRGLFTGGAGSSLTLNAINSNGSTTYELRIYGATTTGFTGTVNVDAGMLRLYQTGRMNNAAGFVVNNASLLLDNTSTTRSDARISNSATITLNSANGTFAGATQVRGFGIRTDQNTTSVVSETVGEVTFASGANYSFVDNQGGTSSRITLTMADIVRNAGATFNIRGRNLGDTNGSAAWSQFEIGDDTTEGTFIDSLVGGGGTAGGTAKNVSIVPWAIGQYYTGANLANTHMGDTFVTYVLNAGFKPLNFNEYNNTFAAAGADENVRVTADALLQTGKTVNSLILHKDTTAAGTLSLTGAGAGETLINTSGAFLFTQNTGAAASTAHSVILGGFDDGIQVGVGGTEYVFHVVNPSAAANTATVTATVSSPLNSTADITKSGRGTLIFTAVNTAGGGANKTTINEGVIEIADLDNIGGDTGEIVFAGGGLRLGTGFTDDLSTRTLSILVGGATIDTNGVDAAIGTFGTGSAGSLTKLGDGILTLNAVANYTGDTNIFGGQIVIGANDALSTAGHLRLGSGTSIGSLDLNGFDQTIGSLSALANNANASVITVDAGNTLTINGDILLSNNTDTGNTDLTISGGGAVVVNGGSIIVGRNTAGTNNSSEATLDLSDLASFTATLTGDLVLQQQGDNSSADPAVMILSNTANTVTAANIFVGASSAGSQLNRLTLGSGTNVIYTDLIHLGNGGRDSGVFNFSGTGGSLVLRSLHSSTVTCADQRVDIIMGVTSNATTGYETANVFDVTGNSADLAIGTLTTSIGAKTAINTNEFKFDQGTLDILNLNLAVAKGAGTSTNTLSIGGGTVLLGGSATYGDAGTGSVSLATAGAGIMNITGGTVTTSVDLNRSVGTGTAQLNLNGGSLDMAGHSIGNSTETVDLVAASGTLSNLSELNGGGDLTKTTAGTLALDGTNTYTGGTVVSAGTLQLGVGTATGTLNTASAISVADTATFAVNRNNTVTQGTDFSGAAITGAGGFAQVGTGTTVLNVANTYTGKTAVTGGKLSISDEAQIGDNPAAPAADQLTLDGGTLLTTATMVIDDSNRGITIGAGGGSLETADATTLTVANVITGAGALTKEGTGSLILTATNTNTGTTTVNAGVLGGTGAVGGDLTVATGTLAPGVGGAGQFTVDGNLALDAGGSLAMEIGGATTNDAATVLSYFNANGQSLVGLTIQGAYETENTGLHDFISVGGAAVPDFSGTVTLSTISAYNPVYGDIFDLLDWAAVGSATGTPTFDFSSIVLDAGLGFNTDLFATNGIVVVVPEPSRALLLMLGLLGLMLRRRRR